MSVREEPDGVSGVAPVSDRALVAAVSGIQNLVSQCAPPTAIYQAVVDGALGLLGGDGGSLRFRDVGDPNWMVAVAWHGSAGDGERWRHRAPISEGLSGRVIATGALAVIEDDRAARTGSQLAPEGTRAIIGVPICEQSRVIGSLVVSSSTAGRRWSEHERDLLCAYAEHVGVAVAVARASHAMREALTDPLTGLANRRLLLDRLQHELVRSDRGADRRRCCSWISTGSNWSTTRSVMTLAISYWRRSRNGCGARSATATCARGWAATSSPSCWSARSIRRWSRSGSSMSSRRRLRSLAAT
jgi:hypothetical protein